VVLSTKFEDRVQAVDAPGPRPCGR